MAEDISMRILPEDGLYMQAKSAFALLKYEADFLHKRTDEASMLQVYESTLKDLRSSKEFYLSRGALSIQCDPEDTYNLLLEYIRGQEQTFRLQQGMCRTDSVADTGDLILVEIVKVMVTLMWGYSYDSIDMSHCVPLAGAHTTHELADNFFNVYRSVKVPITDVTMLNVDLGSEVKAIGLLYEHHAKCDPCCYMCQHMFWDFAAMCYNAQMYPRKIDRKMLLHMHLFCLLSMCDE